MNKSSLNMDVFNINCFMHVYITDKWDFPKPLNKENSIIIFVIEGNKGKMKKDKISTVIEEGDLLAFRLRKSRYSIEVSREPMIIYYIEFSSAKVCAKKGEWSVKNQELHFQGKISTEHKPIVYHWLTELYTGWTEGVLDTLKTQYYFSAVRDTLAENTDNIDYLNMRQAIESIVEQINEHFDENIQMKQIAQFSGMSETTFYHHFKKYTSLTPNQYVTKKRIEHACNLLMNHRLNIHEIAKKVGYKDPYYFSRVFKKNVGIPPCSFQKLQELKIVILTPAIIGDLKALGIPRENIILMVHKEKQHKNRWGMKAYPFQQELLRKEKPDIIIGTDSDEKYYNMLSELAPTRLIPYKEKTWREQFIQLGEIIHAREMALSWLYFYDLKAVNAKNKILENINSETILVARLFKNKLRIFGEKRRKVGDLIYRELNLQPPTSVSDFHFKDVARLEDLNHFNADNILLLDDSFNNRHDLMLLKGNIYRSLVNPWLDYSALGQARSVDEAVEIFAR